MIERLTIVGVGLLGGSVARAVRSRGLAREIVGVGRRPERLAPALADGTLDRAVTDLADGLRGADVVLLALPVLAAERLLPAVWRSVSADALVTDVGSTKGRFARAADTLQTGRRVRFVGSHPLAGSELAGYAAARADLFERATVIVTPTEEVASGTVKEAVVFWESLGARASVLDPETHDRVVAAISHLPHLAAYALVETAAAFEPGALDFAARGFRDTTRIAASDPEVWREIFLTNRDALRSSLGAYRAALDRLEALVEAEDDGAALRAALAELAERRRALG